MSRAPPRNVSHGAVCADDGHLLRCVHAPAVVGGSKPSAKAKARAPVGKTSAIQGSSSKMKVTRTANPNAKSKRSPTKGDARAQS